MPSHFAFTFLVLAAAAVCADFGAGAAHASNFKVLHAFSGPDGYTPDSGLIADSAGNLYGTTKGGGANGFGTVFRLAPDGTATDLYSFKGGNKDGASPLYGHLVMDGGGNLYGTTSGGGKANMGTVFKLAPDGTETVLHFFKGKDGEQPQTGLVLDAASGNLYGTAFGGSQGVAFVVTPDGQEQVLHTFAGGSNDGGFPQYSQLIEDAQGNLFGTTAQGGTFDCGTVFEMSPAGTVTLLHSFQSNGDGVKPTVGLTVDGQGNYFGTTSEGGRNDDGAVFRLDTDGTETVLHSFSNGKDGRNPGYASLIIDKNGNLYGTTPGGGRKDDGVAFEIAPDKTETILKSFTGTNDGSTPYSSLLMDSNGNLFGTASSGGKNHGGTVFELSLTKGIH